jgi:putative DNA-invertase from lambdoid prophage Rac
MPRTLAYVRVSTTGQTTENQVQEIEAAGFKVEPHRIIAETISGSTAIAQRPGFIRLMDRLESGDVLVVTKLDRLGRDAIDVSRPSLGWRKWGCECIASLSMVSI